LHREPEEDLMTRIEGHCLCGKVSYSADAEPVFVGVCHCTDCQHFTGSAFATVVALPAPVLKITGLLKTFTKLGDTVKAIHRRFCPECGSGIVDEADALPGVVMVNAGTLEDRSWVKPHSEVYCDSAQPWVRLGGELQRFGKMPA
jgi:hypothetical protein